MEKDSISDYSDRFVGVGSIGVESATKRREDSYKCKLSIPGSPLGSGNPIPVVRPDQRRQQSMSLTLVDRPIFKAFIVSD
ncbi:hypothetical protein RRG08_026078 [Elysia crispata]|uniref:Uncharacterized protein n=1 Tax=Elysia crispata TaxID=231223 RepID=A0AAE0YRG2_9GAST|nr:hypothetical protein RRG08_026078 [Elysia crispata]